MLFLNGRSGSLTRLLIIAGTKARILYQVFPILVLAPFSKNKVSLFVFGLSTPYTSAVAGWDCCYAFSWVLSDLPEVRLLTSSAPGLKPCLKETIAPQPKGFPRDTREMVKLRVGLALCLLYLNIRALMLLPQTKTIAPISSERKPERPCSAFLDSASNRSNQPLQAGRKEMWYSSQGDGSLSL